MGSRPLSKNTVGSSNSAKPVIHVLMLTRCFPAKGGQFFSICCRRIMVVSFNTSSEFGNTAMKTVTVCSSRPPPGRCFRAQDDSNFFSSQIVGM